MGAGMGIQMGTQIIGGELQGWAALLEQQAMYDALQKQMQAQYGFQQQAYGGLANYLPSLGSESANQKLGQAATTRQGDYAAIGQRPLGVGGQGQGTAADQAQLGLAGQNRAALGAYSDYSLGQGIGNNRMQDLLTRISARAKGSSQVFPYQLQDAQHSQDIMAAVGSAISSLGGGSTNYSQLFSKNQNPQQFTGSGPTGGSTDFSAQSSPYTNVG